MYKLIPSILFSTRYLSYFIIIFSVITSSVVLFFSLTLIAHAQLSGCGQVDIGKPPANAKPPSQCATNGALRNPFPGGWIPSRLDMGYDGTFKGDIVAPFSGYITYAANSFSNWGGFIELKADKKPAGLPTSTLYFAEGVGVVVKAGTHVNAGDPIAKPVSSVWNGIVGNIEWGVAVDSPSAPSANTPTNPYAEGPPKASNPKQMVLDFTNWAEQTLHVAPPSSTGNAGYP